MKFICVIDNRLWWQKLFKPVDWEEIKKAVDYTLRNAREKKTDEPGVLLYDMDVKVIEVDI